MTRNVGPRSEDVNKPIEAVLFDFFGTLVDYEPDRTQLGYPETLRLVQHWDNSVDHETFLSQWDASHAALEAASGKSFKEFTMLDAARAYAVTAGLDLSHEQLAELAATFTAEWGRNVVPIDGVAELITNLSGSFRLGIVSNTNDPDMVPAMLQSMGIARCFEMVLLSVDHGYSKPHPSIYDAASRAVGCAASHIVFVGDSYESDYVGPSDAGMHPYLIDPEGRHPVPGASRLDAVLDLEARRSRW